MNQNYQTRLEAAFLRFLNENIRPDYINKVDARGLQEAQQQITELFLEIIGEDEDVTAQSVLTILDEGGMPVEMISPIKIRNQLKAEQRKAIEDE